MVSRWKWKETSKLIFSSQQKSLLIVFALVLAVSCDVSHVVQGQGWSKGPDGYVYDIPAQVKSADPEPVVATVVEEVEKNEPIEEIVEVSVPEVEKDYLPPNEVQNEYLPPTEAPTESVKRRLRKLRFRRRH